MAWKANKTERLLEINEGFQMSRTHVVVDLSAWQEDKPQLKLVADHFTFRTKRQVLQVCSALMEGLEMLEQHGHPLE